MQVQWLIPTWAWPVLLLAAAGCFLWSRHCYEQTVPPPPPGARRLLIGLRTVTCLLILLALARPILMRLLPVREPAVLAVVVEDSGSMALQDRDDTPGRWEAAWSLAGVIDSLLIQLPDPPDLILLRGTGRGSLVETDLASALADTPRTVGSDLPALVVQARQRLLGRSLRGLVVVSDGHSQNTSNEVSLTGSVPLWFVGVGEVQGSADRFLADLRYPDTAFRGEPITVDVAVGQRWGVEGAQPGPLVVRLLHEGEVVVEEVADARDLSRFQLTWTPTENGLAVLELEVAPLDNERFLANNKATLAVDVRKDRARILLLASQPDWNVRFLAQAALREPRLQLTVVRPGPEGPVLADSLSAWTAPSDATSWLDTWDGVVLVGPPGRLLPDGGSALSQAVRQGLGLLAVMGHTDGNSRPRIWPAPLAGIFPVAMTPGAVRQGEWFAMVPDSAGIHPLLSGLASDPDREGGVTDLPPLQWLQSAQARVEAVVLLQVTGGRPLLAAGRPGEGRVLWFGATPMWQQGFWQAPGRPADTPSPGRRMIQQMLVWTALGDEVDGISLLGQRLMYEEGEPVPVAARWRDLRGDPVTGQPMTIEVSRPDDTGPGQVHNLHPDPRRPGVATIELPPLAPGRWRLTPRSLGDTPTIGTPRDIVISRTERELAQIRQDRRNLRQVAARAAGTYLDAGEPQGRQRLLADLSALDLEPRQVTRQDRHEPMSGWVWLALVVGLLASEWLLRRRYGLL